MDFDAEHKVIGEVCIETMTQEEAVAFMRFLRREILRHKREINQAYDLIVKVSSKFGLSFDD